jgi:hypothetical protein
MKRYILLITLIALCLGALAQTKEIDLKHGKYISGIADSRINGIWHCRECDDSLQVVIKKRNKHYQKNGLNVNFDILNLTINKLVVNSKDISRKFVENIELTALANDTKTYDGIYRDPVTENYIIVSLHYVDEKNFTLTTRFPEMEPRNDNSRGIIFKKMYEFVQ